MADQHDGVSLANPVINSPYEVPARHFEIGPNGPTGALLDGRRASESFVPVAPPRKGRRGSDHTVQETLLLTQEQVTRNDLINDLRRELALWRGRGYDGVTPTTRKLLLHWADEHRENRVLFAQREAAETAVFLAEVSGRRQGYRDWRGQLDEINDEHNGGLPRIALKMATGSGKTVVMAMLIAWQTLNKVMSPRDARFVRRFLIIAPGITIRDRLRVLQPGDSDNYYDKRDLIPADLRPLLGKAQILIVNYHQFMLRDAKEIRDVSKTTRKILTAGKDVDQFKETEGAMVSRVLRGWGVGSGKKQAEILVINDEAHHCYQDKPIAVEGETADAEDRDRNDHARVWFKGIQAIARKVGVKQVYDLSATPFYLKGSGHKEGFIFPWVVSDFALMDAIESGIVKVPRTPVDDNAASNTVAYLNLWDQIGNDLPKRNRKDLSAATYTYPDALIGALRSLYRSYEQSYRHWQETLEPLGHTPPVFIVVCSNTVVSKLVHDWIAGYEVDGRWAPGQLELFSNVVDGQPLARPRTILVDSAQLESGEAMKKDFKDAAGAEIEAYKQELRLRNPGVDTDNITDEQLLREVMNTVGKPGRLGEQVRCVVSVAMLTEGWDANTVTHILGIRAFRSQLLCEQVVGRGLRRRSYDVNEHGLFEPEYAQVYGIPFAFIPTDRPVGPERPPRPSTLVQTVPGRERQRITFPRVTGYRLEMPERGQLSLGDEIEPFLIGRATIPTTVTAAPVVGEDVMIRDEPSAVREQTVAFELAKALVGKQFRTDAGEGDGDLRPWLFPELVTLCRQWVKRAVRIEPGYSLGHLIALPQTFSRAVDAVYGAIVRTSDAPQRLRPILSQAEPVGSTARVSFTTRKTTIIADPDRCEVSHIVLDGDGGNTWEQILSAYAESNPDIAAYVKNDHLGFEIPYVHEGKRHNYVPDFLIRLRRRADDPAEPERTLIVEVSGGQKRLHTPGLVDLKILAARDTWCVAVNNHGGFGRWGYLEITDPARAKFDLSAAIEALYADGPIIGDPQLLDFMERRAQRVAS